MYPYRTIYLSVIISIYASVSVPFVLYMIYRVKSLSVATDMNVPGLFSYWFLFWHLFSCTISVSLSASLFHIGFKFKWSLLPDFPLYRFQTQSDSGCGYRFPVSAVSVYPFSSSSVSNNIDLCVYRFQTFVVSGHRLSSSSVFNSICLSAALGFLILVVS